MKLRIYLISFIVVLLSFNNKEIYADSPKKSDTKKIAEIEDILNLVFKYYSDTVALKAHLAPTIKKAKFSNDIPILWAYNMLMADIYSIRIDNKNPYSDRYYTLAHQILENKEYKNLEFTTNARQGYYNFIYRRISEAFPYFLQADHLEPEVNVENVPDKINHYRFIANFYSYIGNKERAVEYLKIILPYSKQNTRERIDILNSIGVFSKSFAEDAQVLHYMNLALKEAELAKDSVWIGIIYGNLSDYAWKQGKVEETFDYLRKNIALSIKFDEKVDAMRANLKMGEHYLALNDWKSALHYVQQATKLLEDKPSFLAYKVDSKKLLADIANLKGNYLEERKYLKEYLQLKEELDEQNNNEEIKKISWKFEVEKYSQTLENNKLQQKELKKTYGLLGLSIFLIAVVIILLIHRSRNKIKIQNIELEKNKLQLDYEKQNLDRELTIVKSSLTEFTNKINDNNIIISRLRKELAEATHVDELVKNKISDELNNMLQSHLMTHERWINFKKEFELVYPNYLHRLKVANPGLTENDLRIIALIKLELNNRSMSDLLGISLEGVKKAKQRLKKKLTPEDIENIKIYKSEQ